MILCLAERLGRGLRACGRHGQHVEILLAGLSEVM
jgi:hypothetical protein